MSPTPANPSLSRKDNFTQWVRERVRWSDTDLVGHANHLTFGAFCETGRSLFLRRYLERGAAESERALFLPVQLILNFLGEVHWPDEVEVGTGILSIGGSSCRVGQGLFAGSRCFGSGETVMVLIDEQTRRPRTIPPGLRAWLQAFSIPQ